MRLRSTTAIAGLVLALGISAAHASLIGATVDVSANYPTATSIFSDGGPATVSAAVEYPTGTFATYNSSFSVDVAGQSFTLSSPGGTSFTGASFNGFVLTVLSGPAILSATLDASSTPPGPVSITLVGNNRVEVN